MLLFANKTPVDAVYSDLFSRAGKEIGLRTFYAFSDPSAVLPVGAVKTFDPETIRRAVPDFAERTFYISGPLNMVAAHKESLLGMGVKKSRIKTDYFPGFAS